MVQSRIGAKLLGMSALVFGLMVLVTSSAQAEIGSNWRVAGTNIDVTSLLPEIRVDEVEKLLGNPLDTSKHLVLALTTKGGTKVEILCTSITTPGIKLGNQGAVDLGKFTFHGCIVKLNGVTSAPCLPKTAGVNDLITTENLEGLIRLHNGEATVLFKPKVGTTLVKIALGEECSIGEEVQIVGKLSLRDSGGEAGFLAEGVKHLIEPFAPLTHILLLGVTGTLNGTVLASLAGIHNGMQWSGKPA